MTAYPTLTSIHGRNAGLDRNGYLIAELKGFRNKTTTVTLDDSDFSITYTDGAAGSKKKVTK